MGTVACYLKFCDATGNVTLMTDYHDNETEYTYTDRNQLSTLTAPGDKTWEFAYNELGQPTDYDIPNGMTCEYGYDSRNRLTAIEYLDDTTVLDGFYYELDDTGNITKTTNEDDSYWDYTYDNRYRLLTANRFNASGNVKAAYSYTYDDGDNMLTKVEPFFDNFDDGNGSGWSTWAGTWSAASTHMENTSSAAAWTMKANTDPSIEMSFKYLSEDTSDASFYLVVYLRYVDSNNRLFFYIRPNQVQLAQVANGYWTWLADNTSATTAQDTWYNYRIVCDGAHVEVWRSTGTDMPTKVIDTNSVTVTSTSYVGAVTNTNSYHEIDDVRILSDSLSNTTTFAVNNANELTSMADYNGTTTFGFDDWGRMTTKARGSYEAEYEYRFGQKLFSATTDFPAETNCDFEYGADGKRISMNEDSVETRFRYAYGHKPLLFEDSNANLVETVVLTYLASVSGSDPSSGTYSFFSADHLGSVPKFRDGATNLVSQSEYSPYGSVLSAHGNRSIFAGHRFDPASSLIHTPLRSYSSEYSRWLARDPYLMEDGTNNYAYVTNRPTIFTDPLGAKTDDASGGRLRVAPGCTNTTGYYSLSDSGKNYWNPAVPLPTVPKTEDFGSKPLQHVTLPLDFLLGPGGKALKISDCMECTMSCSSDSGTPQKLRCCPFEDGSWKCSWGPSAPRGPVDGDGLENTHPDNGTPTKSWTVGKPDSSGCWNINL